MFRIALLLLSLVSFPMGAQALALGGVELNSQLNQRLDARIRLHSVNASEADDLKVSLADKSAFADAGLERPFVLNQLRFKIVREAKGHYIQISSRDGIKEPQLNFIVAVEGPQGILMREYVLLLETQ